jgi:biotin carboxylase
VVWPHSTARLLGQALRRRGWTGIAVLPSDPAALGMTGPPVRRSDWWQVLDDPGDLSELAAELADAAAVLPGDESAVPLAAELADKLGLPGSSPDTSAWRTDKIVMQRAMGRAGVAHPITVEATSLKAALAAAADVAAAAGWPVVVKPRWSASSVGVRVCHSPAEVAAAWAATAGQPGALGEVTQAVAVQEYVSGGKWTVDTVTVTGADGAPVHKITSLWREHVAETGGHIAWGDSWLVPPAAAVEGGAAAGVVAAYARAVLDAAEVVWGPACTEVMLTAAGPRLVEVMARLAGCYPVHLVEKVTGQSQVTSAVDALADPDALARRRLPAGDGRAVAQAWLAAPHDGFLDGAVLSEIRGLPSVAAASAGLVAGAAVRRTIDTTTSPGNLALLGEPAQVERDIAVIRAAERRLYRRHR